VIIDPHRMRQILYNLIDNSLKFTLAGSVSLTIATSKTSEDQAAIELKVRDTGVGIPDSEISRVFEPYEQLSSASAPNCFGTGLGLAVTRRLCELMGGRIQVESSVGVGSQFTVIIPAALAGSSLEVSGDTGHSSSTASKSGRNG